MKKILLAVGLLSLAGIAFAAGKPCEELKVKSPQRLMPRVLLAIRWKSLIKAPARMAKWWVLAKQAPKEQLQARFVEEKPTYVSAFLWLANVKGYASLTPAPATHTNNAIGVLIQITGENKFVCLRLINQHFEFGANFLGCRPWPGPKAHHCLFLVG